MFYSRTTNIPQKEDKEEEKCFLPSNTGLWSIYLSTLLNTRYNSRYVFDAFWNTAPNGLYCNIKSNVVDVQHKSNTPEIYESNSNL